MKVVYLIQTHKNPEQIYRLVKIIRKSSPESYILVSHDFNSCNLDIAPLQNLLRVEILKLRGKGGRGDFSMIQGYLDAVNWLYTHNINFDWLINLTGQDYPTQPLSQVEKFLAETKYDGFLEYFETLADCPENLYGQREGYTRYLYQYWRSNIHILLFGTDRSLRSKILNRLGKLCKQFNDGQNFSRIGWVFDGIMIGFRAQSTPFNENFICYGGSYFHTISRKCVRFLFDFSQQNQNIVNYYRKTSVPVESFIQTVLVNSKLFNLCNDCKRFFDFPRGELGSPYILTFEDYPLLIKDDIHFARKFDTMQDSKILDMLDARILERPSVRNK